MLKEVIFIYVAFVSSQQNIANYITKKIIFGNISCIDIITNRDYKLKETVLITIIYKVIKIVVIYY